MPAGATSRSALALGAVDVWRIDLDGPAPLELLTPAERQRADRSLRPVAASRRAASRAARRALVADYGGEVHVCVAHSGPIGVVAVALEPVGVDVEQVRALGARVRVAERAFGTATAELIGRLAEPEREIAFLRHWTRREALIKLAGPPGAWTAELDVGEDAVATLAVASELGAVSVRRWN